MGVCTIDCVCSQSVRCNVCCVWNDCGDCVVGVGCVRVIVCERIEVCLCVDGGVGCLSAHGMCTPVLCVSSVHKTTMHAQMHV